MSGFLPLCSECLNNMSPHFDIHMVSPTFFPIFVCVWEGQGMRLSSYMWPYLSMYHSEVWAVDFQTRIILCRVLPRRVAIMESRVVLVHRLCGCRRGVRGTCYVCYRPRSCLVLVVSRCDGPATPSSPTSISITKERYRLPVYLSQAYLNASDCVMHIWPNNFPHDIPEHDPPCTYTYICT